MNVKSDGVIYVTTISSDNLVEIFKELHRDRIAMGLSESKSRPQLLYDAVIDELTSRIDDTKRNRSA